MIETVYVEREIASHPRAQRTLAKLPSARVIPIDRFGEILNRKRQDFRLQKQQPALILARKFGRKVLPTPAGYGIGQRHNYYFSHSLNCLYDCRYCFLQGMFRSAHHVLFVNWDEFTEEIGQLCSRDESVCFFSGYDCDSLALDKLTGFVDDALDYFSELPKAWLELRTKSVQVEALRARSAVANCVVAMSFTPQLDSDALEPGVPSVERRLAVLADLASRDWSVGLRFDPLICNRGYRRRYEALFDQVFERIEEKSIHSVTFGRFRMPKLFLRNLEKLYPDDPFLAQEFSIHDDGVGFNQDQELEMLSWCRTKLLLRLPPDKVFECSNLTQLK